MSTLVEQPPVAAKNKPAAPASPEQMLPLPGIRAWLGALKAVSLLAAAGFIAKLAHEQMLGIQLTDWSALDLSLFAGRWVVDTLTAVLDTLARGHYLGLIWIVLGLFPALAMMFAQDFPRVLRAARFAGIGVAAVALGFVIVHDEVPMFGLSNWLTDDLTILTSPAHTGRLGGREAYMRYIYFISKTSVQQSEFGAMQSAALASSMNPTAPNPEAAVLDPLSLETGILFSSNVRTDPITAEDAAQLLSAWYCLAFLICALSLFTCYVFVLKGGHDLEDEVLSALYYFTAFVLLPIACALLPYMYGKLLCSADFPTATVTVEAPQKDGNNVDYKGKLIGQANQDYTLLTVESAATQTHVFAESTVQQISVVPDANQDIVSYVLTSKAIALQPVKGNAQARATASNATEKKP